MESSDPMKQLISGILIDEKLEKDFNLDKRKFSRNMEWSLFSNMLNTGATVDSNVIFSEKSSLPRSVNLNLTMHMFGHSLNMVEVGGRAEGLEMILQQVFASEGNEDHHQQHHHQQQQRPQGGIFDDINVLDGRFADGHPPHPKGSLYVKVFGNEVRYQDFHEIDLDSVMSMYNYADYLNMLTTEQDYELTKSSVILDAEIIRATISGFPLRLSAEGAYSMNLKTNGKVDLMSWMLNPKKIDIYGSIEPRLVSISCFLFCASSTVVLFHSFPTKKKYFA